MKFIQSFAIALVAITTPLLAGAAPGYTRLKDTTLNDRPLTLSVWYPSDETASAKIGGNAVFVGTPASVDASTPTSRHPLIIVSHGGLRSAVDTGAWLSAALAQTGSIVVEVNSPRPHNGPAATGEIWQRPQDITRALDHMLNSPVWGDHIDQAEISAVGFALGGTAALLVAGQAFNADHYRQSCARRDAGNPDCDWYAGQGVDLSKTDVTPLEQPLSDARITSAVALAPEYLTAFDPDASSANPAVLLMSFGSEGLSSRAAGQDASVVSLDATAPDAFSVCTKAGADILREDGGDDTLCAGPQANRLAVHKAIAAKISTFLGAK